MTKTVIGYSVWYNEQRRNLEYRRMVADPSKQEDASANYSIGLNGMWRLFAVIPFAHPIPIEAEKAEP